MKKYLGVHFSSIKQDWRTPEKLYNELNKEFNFNFDPCPVNPKQDGLQIAWKERNFCNPPYNQISKWIEKGYNEAQQGKTVVFLIPSRTDTRWWHNYVMKATEIRFIKGRVKFSGHKQGAPFPSCIVIFKDWDTGYDKNSVNYRLYMKIGEKKGGIIAWT